MSHFNHHSLNSPQLHLIVYHFIQLSQPVSDYTQKVTNMKHHTTRLVICVIFGLFHVCPQKTQNIYCLVSLQGDKVQNGDQNFL